MSDHRSGARNLAEFFQPFFDGCARGELLIPRCRRCSRSFFYPTVLCPHCHNLGFDWVASPGRGKVYSYTSVHRPLVASLRAQAPYIVAVVELDEGVRMMTNILRVEEADVAIGDPVEVEFGTSWDGRAVPFFRLASQSG